MNEKLFLSWSLEGIKSYYEAATFERQMNPEVENLSRKSIFRSGAGASRMAFELSSRTGAVKRNDYCRKRKQRN